jgi:hypothetical protein
MFTFRPGLSPGLTLCDCYVRAILLCVVGRSLLAGGHRSPRLEPSLPAHADSVGLAPAGRYARSAVARHAHTHEGHTRKCNISNSRSCCDGRHPVVAAAAVGFNHTSEEDSDGTCNSPAQSFELLADSSLSSFLNSALSSSSPTRCAVRCLSLSRFRPSS